MPKREIVDSERIKSARKNLGWTQGDLAKKADISIRAIQDLESKGTTSLTTLNLVAEQIDIPVSELLRQGKNDSSSDTSSVFDVPFRRNQFFVGRDDLFELAEKAIFEERQTIVAVSGLGGIGKSQFALEFAYRNRTRFNHVLWAPASSDLELRQAFVSFAKDLRLANTENVLELYQEFLSWAEYESDWILILDNADNPAEIESVMPKRIAGQIVLTSRDQIFDCLGKVDRIDVTSFNEKDSISFFSERTGVFSTSENQEYNVSKLHSELGGLPLALEQAAAYVVEKEIRDLSDYLHLFEKQRLVLLNKQRPMTGNYNDTVASTWSLSFDQVSTESEASVSLMDLTAYFKDSSPIPFSFVLDAVEKLPKPLKKLIMEYDGNDLALLEALAPLARYSLVKVEPELRTYSMHLLVQEVIRSRHEN